MRYDKQTQNLATATAALARTGRYLCLQQLAVAGRLVCDGDEIGGMSELMTIDMTRLKNTTTFSNLHSCALE